MDKQREQATLVLSYMESDRYWDNLLENELSDKSNEYIDTIDDMITEYIEYGVDNFKNKYFR